MARTLDTILAEVNARSDPQKKIILGQISDIPNQIKAEEAGLQAKQSQSFDEILGGARRRGLGFSGIPLAEQANYTATEFLPAVARLKQSGQERKATLESALADIGSRNYTTAQDIYNQDRNFAEQQRQFNENLAWQQRQFNEQLAESRRSSGSGGFGIGYGGNTAGNSAQQPLNAQDQAYLSVQSFLSKTDREIISDYNATAESARRGNAMDKMKLDLYKRNRPDLFNYVRQSGGSTRGIPSF